MLGNKFGLVIRDGENHTSFVARLMRAEFMHESADIVESLMQSKASGQLQEVVAAYNHALMTAAALLRQRALEGER